MGPILNLAVKDLRVLWRDKLATFFIVGFPILMGLFFGYVFGGSGSGGSGNSKITLQVVDEDQTEMSAKLIELLEKNDNLKLEEADREKASENVRLGRRVAFLAIPKGYGENAGAMWREQVPLDLGVDPSRSAEGAMLEGFLMQAAGEMMMSSFSDFDRTRDLIADSRADAEASSELEDSQKAEVTKMFDSMQTFMDSLDQVQNGNAEDTSAEGNSKSGPAMNLAEINRVSIVKESKDKKGTPASGFAVSFPQGMIWGVLACCAGFAISIARERSRGTLLRLQASPLSVSQVLMGKAVACFIAVCGVILLMTVIGEFMGLRPHSYGLLAASVVATAICFVGIMMTMSVIGKTEEAVSGSGWAVNMIMAMLGGGMIPLMVMPSFFKQLSLVSPVRWAIYSLEGAIWRQLTVSELIVPWTVLLSIGLVGFVTGTTIFHRSLKAG